MKQRSRFFALVVKESLQICRDPSSLLIAFILPLILLFIFGFGVSFDPDKMKIGVVVENATPMTDNLVAGFQNSRFFNVKTGYDVRQFNDLLADGHVKGIVVIPANFQKDVTGNKNADIQIIVDGSQPNTANFVKNYVLGILAKWGISRTKHVSPIIVEQQFRFNPELESRYFLVPGSIAIVMALVGTLLTSLVVAREWERGTMEAMIATPVTVFELLAGKLLPYFLLGLISMTICLVLAVFLFHVPFRGSVLALYMVSASFLVPALGQGFLISAATKNQFIAAQIALLSGFLPAVLLSGFIFDIASMPKWIQWLTLVIPARYFIAPLQTVFLAGDIWPMFFKNIAAMQLIGFVLFILAAKSTGKRIG